MVEIVKYTAKNGNTYPYKVINRNYNNNTVKLESFGAKPFTLWVEESELIIENEKVWKCYCHQTWGDCKKNPSSWNYCYGGRC